MQHSNWGLTRAEGENHFNRFMLQSKQQVELKILRYVFQPDHNRQANNADKQTKMPV